MNESVSSEFRKRVVSEFVKDVAEGRLGLNLDYRNMRPEDIQMIGDILSKLIKYLNEYVLGVTAGEEFDFLERQLFFSISVLRSYEAFKTTISQSRLEEDIQRLESKIDHTNNVLTQLLVSNEEGRALGSLPEVKNKRVATARVKRSGSKKPKGKGKH